MESDWACLPEDLLILILDKLVSLSDYVRFTAVCMPWHSVALDKYRGERPLKLSMHQPPLLFLTHSAQPSSEGKTTFSIYNVSENKACKLKTFIPCDTQSTYHYGDSYHGWMISADEEYVISLSNPFCSKVKGADDYGIIRLSPFSQYCYTYNKVILSANPIMAPDDYSVMVIYNDGQLAFIRPGDDKGWTCIERSDFLDVIYSKAGLFYALDEFGSVKICHISEHSPELNEVAPRLSPDLLLCPNLTPVLPNYTLYNAYTLKNQYIVESPGGDLLQILRLVVTGLFYNYDDKRKQRITTSTTLTEGFEVFVLDGKPKWVETKSLGDGALFLGEKTSIYVSASDFPGCQPNSIYFTDRQNDTCFASNYDMSIFNLGDGSFQRNCVLKFLSTRKNIKKFMPYPVSWWSPPCWIQPTFQLESA
ncbi:F-box protein At2g26160-like [Corylus avellana]|uniref:F-box protein At2g26160-like n=1 Tax=Corylus avellana TaxID=13451 RepID=UPI00286BA086|nr:F-box protein At2g26160-like [Corylus avellana]